MRFALLLFALGMPVAPVSAALAQQAEVRLEAHNGKTRFYLGEPIRLDLVFRNTGASPLTINATDYGDLSETVSITPAEGWTAWRGQSGHDYASVSELTAQPVRVAVRLNDGYVVRTPGHYTVAVTTRRVSAGKPMSGTLLPAMTTNEIGIDLDAMPDGMEAEIVHEIQNELVNAGEDRVGYAARSKAFARLAALQGDAALAEKMRLIVAGDEEFRSYLPVAMATTTNLQRQLDLLHASWTDPSQEPQYDVPSAMDQTRRLMAKLPLPGWQMAVAPTPPSPQEKELAAARDMDDLLASMPQRTGHSRTEAAYFLLEFPGLSDAKKQQAHEYAVEEFPRMDDVMQGMLLQTARPPLRDARLLPTLQAVLAKQPNDREAVSAAMDLTTGDTQKTILVHAMCAPNYPVQLETLQAFHGDRVPEADTCLAAALTTSGVTADRPAPRWTARAVLAARFATPAILPAVRKGWQQASQDAGMLAVLMRMAPADAAALLLEKPGTSLYEAGTVYESLHQPFPKEVLQALRTGLNTVPQEQRRTFAYELSRFGTADDEALLEQQLVAVRNAWQGKSAEVESAKDWNTPAGQARAMERDLIGSLLSGTAWKLPPGTKQRLGAGCLTEECRRNTGVQAVAVR